MNVSSPLADLEMTIGEVRRKGNRLIVTSGDGSTVPATIRVHPRDITRLLSRVFRSPGVLAFVLFLPWFAWRAAREPEPTGIDINNPWA